MRSTIQVLALAFSFAAPTAAQEAPSSDDETAHWFGWERLSGDWGGARSAWVEHGFGLEAFVTLDVLGNVAGGLERGVATPGSVDVTLDVDLERALGWEGGRFLIYGLGNFGSNPSELVGDVQGLDNIAAPADVRVFESWLEQSFFDGELSLLFGLYDVNSEFDVVEAGSLFINSSFGMSAAFGLSGVNGPSTFPVTSLGSRIEWRPSESVYARAVVSDGVPDAPEGALPAEVVLSGDDGLLIAFEAGYSSAPELEQRGRTRRQAEFDLPSVLEGGHFNKFALGVWTYTGLFDVLDEVDANGEPVQRRGNWGVYALGERMLIREVEDQRQGLSVFLQLGIADDDVNLVDGYIGSGIVYRGLFAGREWDRTGLGVAAARFGSAARNAARQLGTEPDTWEIAVELTHRAVIAPSISLQPELQYVVNPGGNADVSDALVVGGRLILRF